MIIAKVISGGQTGVDRAAWDAAIEVGVPWGGFVPRGRRAEDGRIADRYDQCVEHESPDWLPRTYANVDAAACTLIIARSTRLTGGTRRTYNYAAMRRSCVMLITSNTIASHCDVRGWISAHERSWRAAGHGPFVLNVAGPRESKCPGIYATSHAFMVALLRDIKERAR